MTKSTPKSHRCFNSDVTMKFAQPGYIIFIAKYWGRQKIGYCVPFCPNVGRGMSRSC